MVILEDFYLDVYEVTNALYAKCVDAGICAPPSKLTSLTRDSYYGNPEFDHFPVVFVSWQYANTFCLAMFGKWLKLLQKLKHALISVFAAPVHHNAR